MPDQMRRALTEDLLRLRDQWQETQALIAEWKAAAEKLKPSRRRKASPLAPEFQF